MDLYDNINQNIAMFILLTRTIWFIAVLVWKQIQAYGPQVEE